MSNEQKKQNLKYALSYMPPRCPICQKEWGQCEEDNL